MELDPSVVNTFTSGLNVPGAHERHTLGVVPVSVTSQYWPAVQLGEMLQWPAAGVGPGVGFGVGMCVGLAVGLAVGFDVGNGVGLGVGVCVG
jgi:hypothetical protein